MAEAVWQDDRDVVTSPMLNRAQRIMQTNEQTLSLTDWPFTATSPHFYSAPAFKCHGGNRAPCTCLSKDLEPVRTWVGWQLRILQARYEGWVAFQVWAMSRTAVSFLTCWLLKAHDGWAADDGSKLNGKIVSLRVSSITQITGSHLGTYHGSPPQTSGWTRPCCFIFRLCLAVNVYGLLFSHSCFSLTLWRGLRRRRP